MDDASKSIHMHACIFHLRLCVPFTICALHIYICFFRRPKYSILAQYKVSLKGDIMGVSW